MSRVLATRSPLQQVRAQWVPCLRERVGVLRVPLFGTDGGVTFLRAVPRPRHLMAVLSEWKACHSLFRELVALQHPRPFRGLASVCDGNSAPNRKAPVFRSHREPLCVGTALGGWEGRTPAPLLTCSAAPGTCVRWGLS